MRDTEPVRGQAWIQTHPVLLKITAFQLSSSYLRSHFPETQRFRPAFLRRSCVWKGNWGWSPWAVLSRLPEAQHRCLTHFICCPSVYRQLYWFSLGKSLTWLLPSPLFLIHAQTVQVHTHVATPAPGAEDRVEAPTGQRVLLGHKQAASPLLALGTGWGGCLLSVIFIQFSQAIL